MDFAAAEERLFMLAMGRRPTRARVDDLWPMLTVNEEPPTGEPPEGCDPPDRMALALRNPIPAVDGRVRFRDSDHTYYVWDGACWSGTHLMSVSSVINYAVDPKRVTLSSAQLRVLDDEKFNPLAGYKYGKLQRVVDRLLAEPVLDPPAVVRLLTDPVFYSALNARPARVRQHVLQGGPYNQIVLKLVRFLYNQNELDDYLDEMYLELEPWIEANHALPGRAKRDVIQCIRRYWSGKADQGTDLHRAIELFLNGAAAPDEITHPDFSRWHTQFHLGKQLAQTLWIEGPVDIFRTEVVCAYPPLKLVGSVDAVYRARDTGEFILVDWKRVAKLETDYEHSTLGWRENGDTYEIVDLVQHPAPRAAAADAKQRAYGSSKYDKYAIQLHLYSFLLGRAGIPISRMALVQIEPGTHLVRIHPVVFSEPKLLAVLEARRRHLLCVDPPA